MKYIIELSFDLRKNQNVSQIKELIYSLGEKYKSERNDFIYESEGQGNEIKKNDCISIMYFENNAENFLNLIKEIKKLKIIKIDCIYSDNEKINMIYTSKKYNYNNDHLKIKTKELSKNNKNNKDILPDFNETIIKLLKTKKIE